VSKLPSRRRTPKPQPVVVRRVGEEPQVVSVDEFQARQHDRQVIRSASAAEERDFYDAELELVQELYVLQRGDAIVLRLMRATELWWFVERVNGPEQTITARTVIFDLVQERDFHFNSVMRYEPESAAEANHWRRRLAMPPEEQRTGPSVADIPAGSLSPRFRWVFELDHRGPCHGYANGCVCPHCVPQAQRWAA
jgi:hypothetical protein